MKHLWINRQDNAELLIFFNGWGMDEQPFSHLKSDGIDVLMFYDYTDLTIPDVTLNYTRTHLAAWSFGVWAYAASGFKLPLASATAFNGTVRPVDAEEGIEPATFMNTAENWDAANRAKFYRRICGGAEAVVDFKEPNRTPEDQLTELKSIGLAAIAGAEAHFTRAVVGEQDRIFGVKPQLNSWNKRNVAITIVPEAHYLFGKCQYWKELLNED